MPLSLSDFQVGETGYVAKLNNNNAAIIAYLNAQEQSSANLATSAVSVASMQTALFGTTPATFGDNSFVAQALGSTLAVSAGTAWAPSQNLIVRLANSTTVDMTGQPAGTYYLNATPGTTLQQAVVSTTPRDPIYSFTWSGSAISNLTRLAPVFGRMARGPETVTYAAALTLDFTRSETLRLRLTGNAAISGGMIAAYDGQRCVLEVTQDGTGGRTLTPPSNLRQGTDVTWALSAGPNTRTHLGMVFNSPASCWDLLACARGFTP